QSKLVKYFSRQLSCKRKVALQERNAKLEGFPQLLHWFRIVDIRKEVMEEIAPGQLSLEELLDMTDDQVCATVEKFGANSEECARLNASLSCLRSVHKSGGSLSKQDWTIQWPTTEPGKENSPGCQPEPGPWGRTHLSQSPKVPPKCGQHHCHAGSPHGPMYTHVDRLTVEGHPGLCPPVESGHRSLPPSPRQRHIAHTPPRTPNIVTTMTPPGTPPVRRRNKLKPPGTPPPSSRKLIHLIPGFTALHRSKSHEFQLGHRVDEAHTPNKSLMRCLWPASYCTPAPKPMQQGWYLTLFLHKQPQTGLGLQGREGFAPHLAGLVPKPAVVASGPLWSGQEEFAEKQRNRIAFGMSLQLLVCAICRLPDLSSSSFWSICRCLCWRMGWGFAPRVHQPILHGAGTPAASRGQNQGEASQGPAVSSAAQPRARPGPAAPPGLPMGAAGSGAISCPGAALPRRDKLPSQPLQEGLKAWGGPERLYVSGVFSTLSSLATVFPTPALWCSPPFAPLQNEEGTEEAQESEDDFEEMNLSLLSARNFPRKASQTSIFLQEWDIPFEQLEIGELIGKGRFGQVFHGRWHGEVAIRLIDIERDNEDQLKAFKREVMAYRQTRHENVVLFMGACMSPPHLAIITSLCKGRTLYSVVRDAKIVLDVNKTRQIAQEIVKGMGYLHAKGILHKDLKSKNVFYDNGKVVITDFGLFSISGVLQAGRRENKLRIQNGWLCHLAPEIIRQLSPDTEEDKLPFSKHSDVFALGTIWYELHAREWPFKTQPAEAIIWQVGRGMKPNLSQIGMGKEISDILLFCWAYEQEERPTFTKLMDMLEKLPKRNRRLSHPGHFWKSAE
ncbi:KSR2 Kinase, partial [Pelecanoides urinatrix]|nr:KSR2 Kinase [Pelecanoides urinatrix]